jgi:hypothetical protein
MKTLTVSEAQDRLAEPIAEVNDGELVVLKDGALEATLRAGRFLDPHEDSTELEAELLKGIDGPVAPYSPEEILADCAEASNRISRK